MTTINPQQDVHFTFPQDEEGEVTTKYRALVSLGKRISEVSAQLQEVLMTMEGLDIIEMGGQYTFQIGIASNFDAEEVIEELTVRLRTRVLSGIITPPAIVS